MDSRIFRIFLILVFQNECGSAGGQANRPGLSESRRKPDMKDALSNMKSNNFFELYQVQVSDNPVKHEYLKEVFIAAIEDGHWRDGESSPPSRRWRRWFRSVSERFKRPSARWSAAGTSREKRGWDVHYSQREALGEPWIYRVLSVDGTRFVPMTSTVLRRIQIESDALWAHWLRGDANDCEIVRLDRKIVAEDYAFISQYFADVNRFPYFMEADLDSMKGENFVQLTKKIYKVSASNVIVGSHRGASKEHRRRARYVWKGLWHPCGNNGEHLRRSRTVLCLMPSIIRKTSTAADQSHRDIPSDAHHGGHRARRQLIHASRGLARNRPMGRLSAIAGRAAGRPPMP